VGEQGADGFRISGKTYGDLEGDAEASLRTDEGPDEIVAFGLPVHAAQAHDFAVRKQDAQREDVVRRHAVLQTVRTAGILGDIAADRARSLTRRVGCVVKPVGGDSA